MSEPQYVQHISGKGEKWEVYDDSGKSGTWFVKDTNLVLPKPEYVLVDPPERWQDVSADCEAFDDEGFNGLTHARVARFWTRTKWAHDGYRLRKVQLRRADNTPQWAFLVEKKVQP